MEGEAPAGTGLVMSYATLMVDVDADGGHEARLRLAAGLADKFNATLIGMSALAASCHRKQWKTVRARLRKGSRRAKLAMPMREP
jgi:hypothetical protein